MSHLHLDWSVMLLGQGKVSILSTRRNDHRTGASGLLLKLAAVPLRPQKHRASLLYVNRSHPFFGAPKDPKI